MSAVWMTLKHEYFFYHSHYKAGVRCKIWHDSFNKTILRQVALTGHAWRTCWCPCPADPTEQWIGWSCCRPCWHWIWPWLWSSCGRDPAAPWRQPVPSDPSPESGSANAHLRVWTEEIRKKRGFVGIRWNIMWTWLFRFSVWTFMSFRITRSHHHRPQFGSSHKNLSYQI